MEHHYSLTNRMLVIFVCGLMLLAALVFSAGLLIGRDWGATEAMERAKEAQKVPTPTSSTPPAATAPNTAARAIRPASAPPGTPVAPAAPAIPAPPAVPAVPAVPAPPAAPAVPAVPAPPKAPSLPALPPLKSGSLSPDTGSPTAKAGAGAADAPRKVAAAAASERTTSGESKVKGYVVYVAAYVSGARAEKLAEQLRGRNLAAQTSIVDKPGQKQLVSVWVGPFDAKAEAQAAVPELKAAGLEDTMIKALTN